MTTVTIIVSPLGQYFACQGEVYLGRKRIYTTEPYPYRMDMNALKAARDWAIDHGYRVNTSR